MHMLVEPKRCDTPSHHSKCLRVSNFFINPGHANILSIDLPINPLSLTTDH